jgi:hypothetical protein
MTKRKRLHWQKSSFSGSSDCIEWAKDNESGSFFLRDSKDPQGPWLEFTSSELSAFVEAARCGELDTFD